MDTLTLAIIIRCRFSEKEGRQQISFAASSKHSPKHDHSSPSIHWYKVINSKPATLCFLPLFLTLCPPSNAKTCICSWGKSPKSDYKMRGWSTFKQNMREWSASSNPNSIISPIWYLLLRKQMLPLGPFFSFFNYILIIDTIRTISAQSSSPCLIQ